MSAYFDTIAHAQLFKKVAERVNDRDVMMLLKLIVKASGKRGIGQGSLCKALHNPPYAKKVIMLSNSMNLRLCNNFIAFYFA